MEIDVHGMYLEEAIEEIIYCLDECNLKGINRISIIHGHKHGSVIKSYIQSEGFLKEIEREGYILKQEESSNPGISIFQVFTI